MPAIVHFLKGLLKENYRVHMTLPVFGRGYQCKPIVRASNLIVHPYRIPRLFLPLVHLLRRKGYVLLNLMFIVLTLIFSFGFHRRLTSRLEPTFIYQMGYNIWLGHFLSKSTRYPLVYRLFGTTLGGKLGRKLGLLQKIRHLPELFIFRHPGKLIVMSNDGTRGGEVLDSFGVPLSKRLFLLNGINKSGRKKAVVDLRKDLPPDAFLVVAMARLVAWKGVDRVIRSFSKALKRNPKLRLAILGDGSQRRFLEQLVANLGIEDSVRFYGEIPNDTVVNTLHQADVFISTQYISNLSNCLLEAIVAGCPIISLSDGSLDGFLRHGRDSILLNPDEVERTLPLALDKLFNDKKHYASLKSGILRKKEELWSWPERIAYELQVIERCIR